MGESGRRRRDLEVGPGRNGTPSGSSRIEDRLLPALSKTSSRSARSMPLSLTVHRRSGRRGNARETRPGRLRDGIRTLGGRLLTMEMENFKDHFGKKLERDIAHFEVRSVRGTRRRVAWILGMGRPPDCQRANVNYSTQWDGRCGSRHVVVGTDRRSLRGEVRESADRLSEKWSGIARRRGPLQGGLRAPILNYHKKIGGRGLSPRVPRFRRYRVILLSWSVRRGGGCRKALPTRRPGSRARTPACARRRH